jgi:hypothetical protein
MIFFVCKSFANLNTTFIRCSTTFMQQYVLPLFLIHFKFNWFRINHLNAMNEVAKSSQWVKVHAPMTTFTTVHFAKYDVFCYHFQWLLLYWLRQRSNIFCNQNTHSNTLKTRIQCSNIHLHKKSSGYLEQQNE